MRLLAVVLFAFFAATAGAVSEESVDGPVQTVVRDEAVPPGVEMQEDPVPNVAFRQDANETETGVAAAAFPPAPPPAGVVPEQGHDEAAGHEHHSVDVTGQPTVTEFKFDNTVQREGGTGLGNGTQPSSAISSAVLSAAAASLLFAFF